MKKNKMLIMAIFGVLIIAGMAFTSVMANGTSTFKVTNLTNRDVYVEVYGYEDADYGGWGTDLSDPDGDSDSSAAKRFFVGAGGTAEVELDSDDTFYYKYLACGQLFDAKLVMKENVSITIYPCDSIPTVMQVKNHLAETVTLKITGYAENEFEIAPGFTIVKVYSGLNTYNYDACDQDFNGVVDILASGKTQFFLRSCEWHASPARVHGEPNPVNFHIINHASFPMILTLIGPENYLVTANPGRNTFQLVGGSYEYNYYMDYQNISGGFFVPQTGNGNVVFSPEYTIDYGVVESEFE